MELEINSFELIETPNKWVVRINQDIRVDIPTMEQALDYISTVNQSLIEGITKN